MLYFLWPHIVYHLVQNFPKNNRHKIRLLTWVLSICLLAPQFYIFSLPKSKIICDMPLLDMLLVSMILCIIMLGFVILLSVMDPVPLAVITAFYFHGLVCFIYSLILAGMTWSSQYCRYWSEVLYFWSLGLSIAQVFSTVFVSVLVGFWILERCRRHSIINQSEKSGMCYEPVKNCPFLWHL